MTNWRKCFSLPALGAVDPLNLHNVLGIASSTVGAWYAGYTNGANDLLDITSGGRTIVDGGTPVPAIAITSLQGTDGNKLQAFDYDGTNNYHLKSGANVPWFTTNWTITQVLKGDAALATGATCFRNATGGAGSAGGVMCMVSASKYAYMDIYILSSGGVIPVTGPATALNDGYYHVVTFQRNGNLARVLVDGVSGQWTDVSTTNSLAVNADLGIATGSGVRWDGHIVYTRVNTATLTDAQIQKEVSMWQGAGLGTVWGASMDFARAGTAYQTYGDGTMALRSAGMPRVGDGVLIEGAGTNLLSYSEDLTNAIYTKIQDGFGHPCTISANGKSSSSGLATMDGIIAPAFGALLGNAPYGVKANATLTAAAYTLSAEVQKGNKNFLYMSMNTDLSWTDVTPGGTKPGARYQHALSYDASRGKVVLFGGSDGASKQDTWEWDGTAGTWTEVATGAVSKPSARYHHALSYDASRGKVVLFGGSDGARKQDTWEWDGTAGTWTDVTPGGTKPSARYAGTMAYDASRGKVVLFGGYDGAYKQDTWEWDGTAGTWTDVTPGGTKPSARYHHEMAYDASRGKIVLFGGFDNASKQDTWEWDGTAGTWTNVTPVGTKPSVRYHHSMAYDTSRGKIVLFGGYDDVNKQDTWEWDGTAGTWTDVTPGGTKPSARRYPRMDYDASRGKVVLFGGSDSVSKQDTWEFSTAAYAYFDINNGIVMGVGASATAKIEAKSGGNYRCSVSSTGTARSYPVVIMPATASGTIYTVGDAATVNGWIGNVQLELGSFPTSYTPNATTSTVNGRLADDLSIPTYKLRNTLKDIVSTTPTMWLDFDVDPSGATIVDKSGAYTLTKAGQPKRYTSPIYGDYHLFDGATDKYTTTVANPAGNFSLHGTFTPSTVSGVHVIASKWNTTSDKRGWTFYQNNATLVLSRSTDGAVGTVLSATLSACLVAGKPTDFTASYDTVNGLVVRADALTAATQAATGAVYASNALFTIGNDALGSGFLGGKLHNLYYYDHGAGGTVLSATDHSNMYSALKLPGVLPTEISHSSHYKKLRIKGEYKHVGLADVGNAAQTIAEIGGNIGSALTDKNRIRVFLYEDDFYAALYEASDSTYRFMSKATIVQNKQNSFDVIFDLANLALSSGTIGPIGGTQTALTLDATMAGSDKHVSFLDADIRVGKNYANAATAYANAWIRNLEILVASD